MASRGSSILNPIVIDASVTISWLLDDEADSLVSTVLNQITRDGAIVPQLWFYEVHNALLAAERRGRLSSDRTLAHLNSLRNSPITAADGTDLQAALELARRHHLSFYDALYLELALRRDLLLATLDRALARAAAASGLLLTAT